MWEHFDNDLLELDIEKISGASESDIKNVIMKLRTSNKKYDPDGEKPYFIAWVRNKKKHYSQRNNNKTARYFGYFIANLCKEQNVSSRWSDQIHDNSLAFLDIKEAEKEIRNTK
jgi:hypothetical protein